MRKSFIMSIDEYVCVLCAPRMFLFSIQQQQCLCVRSTLCVRAGDIEKTQEFIASFY